jgi:D-glycero-D-manno-heptose 1,7-bisphosphate phosphatase
MLIDAAERFNIDLKSSFMVGDSQRDIEAGKNAGCTTIRVKTGHGLTESAVQPNYHVENLSAAVDLIESLVHQND